MPTYTTIPEYELTHEQRGAITTLRKLCFPDHAADRSYYKQFPHSRILCHESAELVGHMGIDFRAIRLGVNVVTTLGLIDLCVAPSARGCGVASELIQRFCELGRASAADFALLFADDDRLYRRHGFERATNTCQWLRIDEHRNHGIAKEDLSDCLMIKPLGSLAWSAEEVDLLGYLY